jgi:hypothetical protein
MGTDKRQTGDGEVRFSRSPIGGKKTETIRFRCAPDLKDRVDRLAHELDFHSTNEFCEMVMALVCCGESHCKSIASDRVAKVARLLPNLRETQMPQFGPQADIGALLENLGRQLQSLGGGR